MGDTRRSKAVHRYHARSTHAPGRFAPGPGHLDWANQPEPFRIWEGAPLVELPLAGDDLTATWTDLHRPGNVTPRPLDRATLGAFLELSLGLTAWKEAGGSRWALRANPSSGNLHPTEGYALVPPLPGVACGVYHYRSRDHVLERRLTSSKGAAARLVECLPEGGFLVGLSSIHWREAWKYGERAFRYCQHDVGHALASIRYAAAVLGWSARLLDAPGDSDVAILLGLDRPPAHEGLDAADREHPDALVLVAPPHVIEEGRRSFGDALDELTRRAGEGEWAGRPNSLSPEHRRWPEIDAAVEATAKPRTSGDADQSAGALEAVFPEGEPEAGEATPATRFIRQRRSAVAMDGQTSVSSAAFFGMMERLLPRPGVPPWDVLPWTPRVHPVLFVHRVEGLGPGLYLLERDDGVHGTLERSLRRNLLWEQVAGSPDGLHLFLLEEGDARAFARLASCQQAIASDSAFSLGMLSVFENSLAEGPWWYRRLFWESGVLGQVLYMEAEVHGVRGTGIGCYFDDVVHELLGLEGERIRDLYHFTVGGAVEDPRLATRPAYVQTVRSRPR
ncbi:MAG: SagB/ThcOx family dehydrogenase [Acidobacteria bacterium]|jgi:SagB-type dehydrogenase family enzyme|nr:SagB/ThcOx family dehydrogenase [Acidobacteriota bacterium]